MANALITFFISLAGGFISGLIFNYASEKGKNLATKQDIQEITDKNEGVLQEYRKALQLFQTDLKFKYDFYYKQYTEIYSYLYAIISQSEYVRDYLRRIEHQEFDYENVPFITISPTQRVKQIINFQEGQPVNISSKTDEIETKESKFNFETMVDLIIQNGTLANQDLLKLAVSYRMAHFITDGMSGSSEKQNMAGDEIIELQKKIVSSIIKTYNQLRKDLKMDYSKFELENGKFESVNIEKK